MPDHVTTNLAKMRWGILLVLLAFVFGFGLGALFGAAEANLKEGLNQSGQQVLNSVYNDDGAKLNAVVSKAWSYYKRAHLHAGAMGAAALSMILLLALSPGRECMKRTTSLLLGVGALGYPSFWLWAGCRAPGLGSTTLAKESLSWLAIPSAGAFILGLLLTILVFMRSTPSKNT